MNNIVLWSGGPHSTYAIYSLTNRGNSVVAIHVLDLKADKPHLPSIRKATGIDLKVVRITPPLTWTKLITMGLSAAHWIETQTTPILTNIPETDKVSAIYLGKETGEEEVSRLIHAISPEFPIREFKHSMDEDELVEMMDPLGFPG